MLGQPRTLPEAPPGFDKQRFFAGIHWHQKWEVFRDVFTPGHNPIEEMCAELELPRSLSGNRVLDIGAWNGCLSFECERRGAREIVALSPEDPRITGFEKLRDLIGSRRVRYVRGTVYDLNPRDLGYFDVVLFCGVLYHLRYPTLGIDNIRRVCRGHVYVETVVSDRQLLVKKNGKVRQTSMPEISPILDTVPLWQFYRRDELHGDTSNWFGPNCCAVVEAFESAGFAMEVLKNRGRATFRGQVKAGPPEFLVIGTTEGIHYDVVTRPLLGNQSPDEQGAASSRTQGFSERVLTGILSSAEYYQRNGNTNDSWRDSLCVHLLGRPASSSGNQVSDELPFRIDTGFQRIILRTIFSSLEYRVRLVEGLYADYLDRGPSAGETSHWLRVFEQWPSIEFLRAEFLGSDEYFKKHGAGNEGWLEQLCAQLLGKASTLGRDTYLQALEVQTMTRVQVALAILESPEYRRHLIQQLYTDFLDRPATLEEVEHWLKSAEETADPVRRGDGANDTADYPSFSWPRRLLRVLRAG